MRSMWLTLKRFLTAEEVPRWFGLSVVLIYLVGLGAVTHFGVVQARSEGSAYFRKNSIYAVRLLGKRLSSPRTRSAVGDSSSLSADVCERELREFAANISVDSLRVVDAAGRIVASLDPAEVGTERVASVPPAASRNRLAAAGTDAQRDTLIRVPIRLVSPKARKENPPRAASRNTDQASTGAEPNEMEQGQAGASPVNPPVLQGTDVDASVDSVRVGGSVFFLEARLAQEPYAASGPADNARALAVVLVVLGVLFVLYRCLRGQLRGMSRIAEQLHTHHDRIEEELDSLRIVDTMDSVTGAWNELIDLTQRLAQSVEHSEADKELSRVLQQSGSGALAEALDCIPDGIIYITEEVRLDYVNAAACRLFGWDRSEEGSTPRTTLAEAQAEGVGGKIFDLVRGALGSDGTYKTHSENLQADEADEESSTYRVRVIAIPSTQRSGECVVVIRDVSQQIRAERAREEFITQVTHELRTPLTNIRAYAETLSSGMFDDPQTITDCYNVITKETRRLSRLIEDILSVSQLEVGSIELQFDQVDLKTLLSDAIRDVRGLADEKNLDLQLVLPSKLDPVLADRDKLAVVLNNLLGNAIKYTPPDGNVVVGCQCAPDEVVITVKDNGIGIDPSEHGRVFEKFHRSSDPAVQDECGTGIGLYTAREIVRHHHGNIDLISQKGQGSTFMVRLPREVTRAATLSSSKEA